jgi:hypothetical protein
LRIERLVDVKKQAQPVVDLNQAIGLGGKPSFASAGVAGVPAPVPSTFSTAQP